MNIFNILHDVYIAHAHLGEVPFVRSEPIIAAAAKATATTRKRIVMEAVGFLHYILRILHETFCDLKNIRDN
jgi:hypothetical protein